MYTSSDGTLRWQSPEIMNGQLQLTAEADVWAFSICCVEVLTMGRIPWPLMDDASVRHFVLSASMPNSPSFDLISDFILQKKTVDLSSQKIHVSTRRVCKTFCALAGRPNPLKDRASRKLHGTSSCCERVLVRAL